VALDVSLSRENSPLCGCRDSKKKGGRGLCTYHNVFWPWQGFLVPFWNSAAIDEHVRACAKVEAGRVR
jgi:hypothetical protein